MAEPDPRSRMPRQIPFIIANEACERFSFYGMRNILTTFLAVAFFSHLGKDAAEAESKDIFHTFVAGVYFFPLLGGWVADRFFGKYRTIFWVSLVYCVGQGMLAASTTSPTGFYVGLFLIALASGGIKPLVASFVGDQFDQYNKHRAKIVFDAFYWSINLGSFFASLSMAKLLRGWGPANWWELEPAPIAFAVPGLLMAIATIFFWAGRNQYVMVPPAPPDEHSFLRVARTALTRGGVGPGLIVAIAGFALALASLSLLYFAPELKLVKPICVALLCVLVGGGVGTWIQLERARGVHPDEAVDGVRSVLRVLVLFLLVTPFWSAFDQKASTWVFQGKLMVSPNWLGPPEMQAFNPALVMVLIPLNNLVIFPALRRAGFQVTQLGRMGVGLVLAGLAWVVSGLVQHQLDAGNHLSIFWQLPQYVLLTMGEVLVSATGLEFAYSQAPRSMKGAIMAFWSLAVTFGNVWVLIVDELLKRKAIVDGIASTGLSQREFLLYFWGGFAILAAVAFALVASRYKVVDNYRTE